MMLLFYFIRDYYVPDFSCKCLQSLASKVKRLVLYPTLVIANYCKNCMLLCEVYKSELNGLIIINHNY
jgi:hypothetical protein